MKNKPQAPNSIPDSIPLLPRDSGYSTKPNGQGQSPPSATRSRRGALVGATLLAGLALLLAGAPAAHADRNPPGCNGSGLGISLFTSIPDVHIGDTIYYSVLVFNTPFPACNAGETNPVMAGAIRAYIVTPDGVTNTLTLRRTFLAPGESDYYSNVVSYVVRAADIRADGTVRAIAADEGDIHQNDTNSRGGGNQGVNTEVNLPCIGIAAQCVGSIGENGAISFTGTVTNCGNTALVGVTVTNFHDGGFFTVLFPTNLAIRQVASFSGSWVPFNPCGPSTATLTVQAVDQFTSTPRAVTSFTTVTCQNVLNPGIQVTKTCPPLPTPPGQLLTFSGSVSNTGNVTLTNIVVVNNQPAANTTVFTRPSLAPGEAVSFSGSYLAPTNCSVADTLTATAASRCGVPVSDAVSASCPILTTPMVAVTVLCPATPAVIGGTLSYGGTVHNLGDIPLTNVVVVSDRPVPNTVVFTTSLLAPGASAGFTSTVAVPMDACSVTTIFSGRGEDLCTLNAVTNTISTTCPVTAAPAIAVTLICPTVTTPPGGAIAYSGTVSNPGNITLNNIFVVNNQPAPNTPVIGPITLAPGASQNFTTTAFTTPLDACAVSSTVTAWGANNCGGQTVTNSASATCPIGPTPSIAVTRNCPPTAVGPGGTLSYQGTVSNTGDISLTNIVVVNDRNGTTPVFTAALLLPGQSTNFTGSYTVPSGSACAITSVLTATGQSQCSGVAVTRVLSTTCPVTTTPALDVLLSCPPATAVAGSPITYSGTVSNAGNVILTNVMVVNNHPAPDTLVANFASLAPGATENFVATFTTPVNTCAISTTVQAWGTDACSLLSVTNQASATCPLQSNARIEIIQLCPPAPAAPGGTLTFSGSVRNSGDVTLTNILVFGDRTGTTPVFALASLAPGASAPFIGSYAAPLNECSVTATLIVTAASDCSGLGVTNSVTTTCTLNVNPQVAVTFSCPPVPVEAGETITYNGTVSNPGTITLNNVTVVNNHPATGTVVLTVPSLAPGASAEFSATFTSPTNVCSVTSMVTAWGTSLCGSPAVTNTASATCPLGTAPKLVVTQACPTTPVGVGELLVYSGSLSNAGTVTLTNIVVVSDQTGPTPVFTAAILLPGQSTNFSGSYTVPLTNDCAVTSTLLASAAEACGGTTVTTSSTSTCLLNGIALLRVDQNCPAVPPGQGEVLFYTGSVSNAGNITLTNIVVVNNRPATNTVVLRLDFLAPGAVAQFAGSYTVPLDCCVVWSTVTATGQAPCTGVVATDTHTTTCPVQTQPAIVVTKECPPTPVSVGELMKLSGVVSNSGNITLLNVNVTVVPNPGVRRLALGSDVVKVIPIKLDASKTNQSAILTWPITLAPGESVRYLASYVLEGDLCGGDTVTATGADVCTGAVVASTVTGSCAANTAPAIAVFRNCPALPIPKGSVYTYSGTVTNTGNSTLVGVMVYSDAPTNQTVVLGPITLAARAGTNFTGSYLAPHCCCYLVDTLTAIGQDRCTLEFVYNTSTSLCPLETSPSLGLVLGCPTAPVTAGTTRNYSGFITNRGDVNLTNVQVFANYPATGTRVLGPLELAPGEVKLINGNFLVPADFSGHPLVISATGTDICQSRPVSAQGSCPAGAADTARLSLAVNGSGTVSGASDGQMLTIGGSYTLIATPAAEATFIRWSGGVEGTSPTLSFVMRSGLAIIANFSTNASLVPLAGTYNGLFFDPNGVQNPEAGFFTLTMRDNGRYSGSLRTIGKKYSVSGTVAADGRATNVVRRSGTTSLTLTWDYSAQPGAVNGTVGDGTWTSLLEGDRAVFHSRNNPSPLAGRRYTVIFPGTSGDALAPEGDGYGRATVDANGIVSFSGLLADGSAVAQKVALSQNGDWPLYVSLYSHKGSLLGWLRFAEETESDVAGRLSWIKPVSTAQRYPAGFGVTTDAMGSRYIAPTSTGTVLPNATQLLVLEGGNLPAMFEQSVTLGAKGRVTTGVAGLSMSFKTSDGSFSGSYKPSGSSTTFKFRGAVLQKANNASGYVLGTTQSGQITLTPQTVMSR